MAAKTVKVNIEAPEDVSEEAKEIARQKAHEAAVLALWEKEAMTASRAAEELDLSMHDFLDLLSAKGLPVVRGPLNMEAVEQARQKLERGRP